ncbi:SHOCT domain-containing protein [Prescottella sp. R16]|uniref:SHOCT domain-containing protein n=1 Tax=Prescottella sp. R16 TaxID=3064529 RepID=UPI00272E2BCB|nr:SHOCT domain-containing protein [Prescottella sp. R16]
MVFRSGRIGRPGLLGTIARSAVVAGTATATSNAVNRRAQQRAAEQQAYEQQQAAQWQERSVPPVYQEPQPAPAPAGDDLVGKLQQLQQLRDSGALSDDEFAAAKAKLLA